MSLIFSMEIQEICKLKQHILYQLEEGTTEDLFLNFFLIFCWERIGCQAEVDPRVTERGSEELLRRGAVDERLYGRQPMNIFSEY